jgi:hypothetical protein
MFLWNSPGMAWITTGAATASAFGVTDRNWLELSIHFQVAERLASDPSARSSIQMLSRFLERHFAKDGADGRRA